MGEVFYAMSSQLVFLERVSLPAAYEQTSKKHIWNLFSRFYQKQHITFIFPVRRLQIIQQPTH